MTHRTANHRPAPSLLVDRYEQVRQEVISHSRPATGKLGRGLIMRQGIAAWIEAWSMCDRSPESRVSEETGGGVDPPGRLHEQLTMILADMALSVGMELRP